ncbi:pilus assembly protein [Massilia suwonensis]|uniref:Pilus assembly protein n=1 Tax=Massilia suwonensis TaxID=648895 RepID=A0ABW0MKX8_9BURK
MDRLMNRFFSLLVFALLAPGAQAAPTAIAQLPLLNITGTGTVKPNLMLLYDNSGSMTSTFTPDYVDDTSTCRSRATMSGGTKACRIGDPPFASADFNKQYYNPKVRYLPPVTSAGLSFDSMTRANTSTWTSVTTDGFNINNTDLLGNNVDKTNLATGFPDLRWCDGSGNCSANTSGYAYPNDVRYTAQSFTANPYYYTINVAEYCTDSTLTNCRVTAVNAPAPAGYPIPARVRWCDSRALTNCQAKYVGNFKYPRFSDPNRNPDWFGTISIGASSTSTSMKIDSVSVVEPNGTFVLTNTAVTASNGTGTAARQAALANSLAASIIARTGLAAQYTACVKTPSVTGVPACSSFGITLESNSVVAVVPINCPANTTSKAVGPCTLANDGSRAGRDLIVASGSSVTALLSIGGSTNPNKTQVLGGLTLGGTQLFSSSLSFSRGVNASAVATAIKNKIGTNGSIKAYIGGTSNTTPLCEAAGSNTVCLVTTALDAEGDNIALGSLSNNTASKTTYLSFGASAAAADGVPTDVTPLGASVFVRTDIVSTRTSYPKVPARSDCAGSTCTYDEEMTNFANWYAYYKTRNQMMKTAVGQAFQPIGNNYNVGIVSLSVAAAEGAMKAPKPFEGSARSSWYSSLYGMSTSGSTPIRQALHAIGKMYANRSPYNYSAGNEVIQFPCQQNFTFVTTDGYWNGAAAADVVNNDNVESASRFCSRAKGCVDPSAQSLNSLADVALYWYNGGSNDKLASLRSSLENWNERDGLVAAAAGENTRLHMNTYALGLGVDGIMNYEPKYDTAPIPGGDFHKLITGVATGCPWNGGGAYVWPNPITGEESGSAAYQSRVDDLWHAAINGHGKYFSASDPLQVIDGLRSALSNIEVKIGAAAAAATSTPNVSQSDNDIFAATFTTVRWYGELQDQKIDILSGAVLPGVTWNSSDIVGRKVSASSDTRRILMLDVENGGLKNFVFSDMTAAEQDWFRNKCSLLAQCPTLSTAERKTVDDGATIVNWLRGQQQYANDSVLRAYTKTSNIPAGLTAPLPIVLGDIASSKPAYQRESRKAYTDSSYFDFQEENQDRQAAVFVGANDGMLHAFDATTGEELWAYAPRITMKKLYAQASTTYSTSHQYTVDGSPEVADVKIGDKWRSVLVSGLNAGGRGYFALDITDPNDPQALWELCADPAVCSGINYDADIGLSFGAAQIGTWKDSADVTHWVAFLSSGYNNIPGTDGVNGGNGKGYIYVVDIATGRVLAKVGTGSGDATTPSGLARISAISENPQTDPLVTYVYGGDNLGQMWRFDFTDKSAAKVLKMGDAGVKQPITTRPEVTMCRQSGVAADGTETNTVHRVVAFGTGRLLDLTDIGNVDVQSAYVLKDSGTAISAAQWRSSTMARQSLAKIAGTSTAYSINGVKIDLNTQQGWYLDFNQNGGERVNLDPQLFFGTLNMVTNLPSSSSSCKVGGTSNIYQLNVCTGEPLISVTVDSSTGDSTTAMAAGMTLSNSAVVVGATVITTSNGNGGAIFVDATGKKQYGSVPTAESPAAMRAGWRRVRE